MDRKHAVTLLVSVLACIAVGAAVLVAQARSEGSAPSPVVAPPDWVQSIVSGQAGMSDDGAVTAVWVLTEYDSAAALVNQQPEGSGHMAYLVVLTSETEFVNYASFSPNGEPSRGKHVVLLIDTATHLIDTFGIGPEVPDLSGLGQSYSYTVE